MSKNLTDIEVPIGTKTLILSKLYYGILSKSLEKIEVERYYAVLNYIMVNNGCCCQQNICNTLHIDKTAMVKILDSLSEFGFIERKVNQDDRRQHHIVLSKKGKKQTKEIAKTFSVIEKEMFKNISEKDKQIFENVLKQATDNLTDVPKNNLFFDYKKSKE